MKPETKRQVTLEDILRLKRAERPPAEFWNEFDRQLRAKQLSALVEKRPWWRSISFPRALSAFTGFSRFHLPLGATAILAVTFVATRDYRSSHASTPVKPAVAQADVRIAPAVMASPLQAAANPSAMAVALTAPSLSAGTSAEQNDDQSGVENLAGIEVSAPKPGEISRLLIGQDSSKTGEATPSARTIAANFAAARAADPAMPRGLLAQAQGFETRSALVRTPAIDPLSQMTSPSDMRTRKLLSAMNARFVSGSANHPAGEHVASGLSNDRLYDEGVRRIAASGNSFTWKM